MLFSLLLITLTALSLVSIPSLFGINLRYNFEVDFVNGKPMHLLLLIPLLLFKLLILFFAIYFGNKIILKEIIQY